MSKNDLSLWEELVSEGGTEEDGYTTRELSEALGVGEAKSRRLLREAKKQGRLVIGRKRIETVDGVIKWTKCYSLKDE